MGSFNVAYQKYAKENSGDQLVVLGIESQYSSLSTIKSYEQTNHQLYPTINNGSSVFYGFNQNATPSAVLVKPDRSYARFNPPNAIMEIKKAGVTDPDSGSYTNVDSFGNACTESVWKLEHNDKSSIDTSGGLLKNSIISVSGTVTKQSSDQGGVVSLSCSFDGTEHDNANGVRVVYKSNCNMRLNFTQNSYDSYSGNIFLQDIISTSEWKTETFRLDTTDLVHAYWNNEWNAYLKADEWAPVRPSEIDTLLIQNYDEGSFSIEIKEITFINIGETPIISKSASMSDKSTFAFELIGSNTFSLNVPKDDLYTLSIFNAAGKIVEKYDLGHRNVGMHSVVVPSMQLASGVHFGVLESMNSKLKVTSKIVIK